MLVSAPGDYGGPTQTMALLPGSPAIGKGVAIVGVTTDQRGLPRPSVGVNIGAFQTQTHPLSVNTTLDGIGSPLGDLSLRQALNLARAMGGAETITPPNAWSWNGVSRARVPSPAIS